MDIRKVLSEQISKKGGLVGSQFIQGSCWERGGDFFKGEGVTVLHKK